MDVGWRQRWRGRSLPHLWPLMKNHMQIIVVGQQSAFLRNHGDAIFDQLCDLAPEDGFRISAVSKRLIYLMRFAPAKRDIYLRCVLRNVEAGPEPAVFRYGPSSQYWFWTKEAA